MTTVWQLAAGIVVAVHAAFLAYVVLGGFVAWRLPRTLAAHVLAVAWGLLIVIVAVPCPLTALQNRFRELAGESPLSRGFIDTYLTGHLYPAGDDRLVQALVGAVVIGSWAGLALRRRRAQRSGQGAAEQPDEPARHLRRSGVGRPR